jgi:hypothetical protein
LDTGALRAFQRGVTPPNSRVAGGDESVVRLPPAFDTARGRHPERQTVPALLRADVRF